MLRGIIIIVAQGRRLESYYCVCDFEEWTKGSWI